MKISVIKKIEYFLFGRKYYLNIINRRGTDSLMPSEFIFKTKEQADKHRDELAHNRSFMYIETVSFRSKIKY